LRSSITEACEKYVSSIKPWALDQYLFQIKSILERIWELSFLVRLKLGFVECVYGNHCKPSLDPLSNQPRGIFISVPVSAGKAHSISTTSVLRNNDWKRTLRLLRSNNKRNYGLFNAAAFTRKVQDFTVIDGIFDLCLLAPD